VCDPLPQAGSCSTTLDREAHLLRDARVEPRQLWAFVVLEDATKKQRIADAVAPVTRALIQSQSGTTASEKRMYEGSLLLVNSLSKVPVIVFVCAKNDYPPATRTSAWCGRRCTRPRRT
jgi:hypothetical protein